MNVAQKNNKEINKKFKNSQQIAYNWKQFDGTIGNNVIEFKLHP